MLLFTFLFEHLNNRTFEKRSKMREKKNDIEERLIDFAVDIIFFVESIETASKSKHTS